MHDFVGVCVQDKEAECCSQKQTIVWQPQWSLKYMNENAIYHLHLTFPLRCLKTLIMPVKRILHKLYLNSEMDDRCFLDLEKHS